MNTLCLSLSITVATLFLWRELQKRAVKRSQQKCQELASRLSGKVLRHSPTGTVGRVVCISAHSHRWFGTFKVLHLAGLAHCEGCFALCAVNPGVAMKLMETGYVTMVPADELAAALPEESKAYEGRVA